MRALCRKIYKIYDQARSYIRVLKLKKDTKIFYSPAASSAEKLLVGLSGVKNNGVWPMIISCDWFVQEIYAPMFPRKNKSINRLSTEFVF